MNKALELSEETYQRLIELAQQQHRTPEEVIRALLLDYDSERYRQANHRLIAEGVLTALPGAQAEQEDVFDPESIPGKPLSQIILEERR